MVVGGGDGTIRTFAGVFAGTGIPLGVLPLGTLNHFARDLGIPVELAAAASTIGAFRTRTVDLGEVNGAIFINNSSIGIYPYLVIDRERQRASAGRRKWTAMALALLRAFRRFPRRRLTVIAEGMERRYRTPCLFVGNNEYDMNFFSLGRRHQLDAGKLHLYVARPPTKWGFVWFVLRAIFGDAGRMRDLDQVQTSSAEITSRASRLFVALDGEVETMSTPLAYRSRPGALTVIAPPVIEGSPG